MAAIAATDLPHDQNRWEFSCDFEVDFDSDSEENASMVYAALAVDKETEKVKRQMSCPSLMGNFQCTLRQ